ncbi:MAG: GH25 family lysozyme [Anaerolineaceae bacterium]
MTRAFGVDISKFQTSQDGSKRQDFNAIKAHAEEVVFIAARAGVSWGYKDPMFDYYWGEMARIKVCRMAYFVVYFGESALSQMDSLFKTLEGKTNWKNDRLVLDLEVAGINTRERITATTLKCLDICKARTGIYPMIYSRSSWVDAYMNVGSLPRLDWWLAHYKGSAPYPLYTAEHPGPPDLPNGVSTYLIHQTGDHNKAIGSASHYMDYDRWNGTKADVLRYFGNPTNPDPEPVVVLFTAKCIVSALYKRSGPGSTYSVVGSVNLGDVVNVYEVKDNWYRIDATASVWCSGLPRYLQQLDPSGTPPSPIELFKAKCIVSALYKRKGPGSSYAINGYLKKDDVVRVYEVTNKWYRIDPTNQVWCSGAAQYMQKL